MSNVLCILTILPYNGTLESMKKSVSPLVYRLTLIILAILILVFVSLLVAFGLNRFHLGTDKGDTLILPSPVADVSQLEFVDGQKMQGENFSVSTDLQTPTQMLLPLRTLADFAASQSATTATITTSAGKLKVELYPQEAPLTVANFISLASSGFYDNLRFHRVEPGFVVQVGDPESRNVDDPEALQKLGTGYPGYRIADELDNQLTHDQAGILSMANINVNGNYPNSGGSQFFITLAPATQLDGRHAIFGKVIDGLDVLDKIKVGDAIEKIQII